MEYVLTTDHLCKNYGHCKDRHPEVTGYMEAKIRTRKFWKRREESAQLWRPRRFIWI